MLPALMLTFCSVAVTCLVIAACLFSPLPTGTSNTTVALWYRDTIVYEINVAVFRDSDADGIGDLQGNIARIPFVGRVLPLSLP